jgi:hypothetical protein
VGYGQKEKPLNTRIGQVDCACFLNAFLPLNTRIGQVDCACFLNAFLTLHVPSDIFQILRNVNHFIRLRQNTLPLDAEMIGFL